MLGRWTDSSLPLMRLVRLAWLMALTLAAWAGPVSAVEVQGLYEAEVPVSGQQPTERERALRTALLQVLVKVSGGRAVTQNPGVTKALKTPSQYVQQYRYRIVQRDTATSSAQERGSSVLWAQFDREAVNRLLQRHGLPIWGKARPAILIWLAVERDGRRVLVGSDDPSTIPSVLEGRAAARGLPLVIPLLDLQDQAGLRVSDVWGEFTDSIVSTSARYQSDVILVARAYELLPGLWEARWRLMLGPRALRWSTQSDVLDIALDEGLDRAADILAEEFARTAQEAGTGALDLVVTEINSLRDYARALRYLGALDMVESVQTTRVQPGQARFRLKSSAGKQAVGEAIALGRTLSLVDTLPQWQFQLVP